MYTSWTSPRFLNAVKYLCLYFTHSKSQGYRALQFWIIISLICFKKLQDEIRSKIENSIKNGNKAALSDLKKLIYLTDKDQDYDFILKNMNGS